MPILSGGPLAARIRTALTLYVFGVLGAFLLAVPWSPLWDHATLFVAQYAFGSWVRSGWVKGLVSGVGALDLWVAVQEAGILWQGLRGGPTGPESPQTPESPGR
jgi:hypothetical protein